MEQNRLNAEGMQLEDIQSEITLVLDREVWAAARRVGNTPHAAAQWVAASHGGAHRHPDKYQLSTVHLLFGGRTKRQVAISSAKFVHVINVRKQTRVLTLVGSLCDTTQPCVGPVKYYTLIQAYLKIKLGIKLCIIIQKLRKIENFSRTIYCVLIQNIQRNYSQFRSEVLFTYSC